jgi:hypothetical protein
MILPTWIDVALNNGERREFCVHQLDGGNWRAYLIFKDVGQVIEGRGATPSEAGENLNLALMEDAAKETDA